MCDQIVPQDELDVKCADEHCGEDVFRDGPLCLNHFVEVETAAWDDHDAERQAALKGMGYVFGDPVIITENLELLSPEEYECNRYRAAVVGGGLYGANKVEEVCR